MFHDMCKVYCYDQNGDIWERNNYDKLIGHVAGGFSQLAQLMIGVESELGEAIPMNTKLHLLHIVLSHHGKLEWGSPVIPKTVEALIVHNADYVESRMGMIFESVDKTPPDREWSEYHRYLGTDVWCNWEEQQ